MKIGCVWAADRDSGADLKVLQQFTACLLETAPPEEEQTPKASKREKKDQQSECRGRVGTEGSGSHLLQAQGVPGLGQAGDFLGTWRGNSEVLQINSQSQRLLSTCVLSVTLTGAAQGSHFSRPVCPTSTHIPSSSKLGRACHSEAEREDCY